MKGVGGLEYVKNIQTGNGYKLIQFSIIHLNIMRL